MQSLTTTGLAIALAMITAAAPLESQGKSNDKGRRENRGNEGRSGNVNRGNDNRGNQGKSGNVKPGNEGKGGNVNRGNQGRSGDVNRANDNRANDNRGNDKSAFGRARAAEVREVGGDVAGPARRARNSDRPFFREFRADEVRPLVRGFAVSDKMSERIAGRAVALAFDRGVADELLIVQPIDNRVRVVNREGLLLFELDDVRARDLGAWRVVTLRDDDDDDDDDDDRGGPAFCRSGAGHPVWGRQWCLEKGFRLGADNDVRWGRAIDLENVVLRRRAEPVDLTRDVLLDVLGDVVFNRLATHALTLGLVDPLVGKWVVEPTSGRTVLLVNSGTAPVAEVVDTNRDDRADLLLVALRPW